MARESSSKGYSGKSKAKPIGVAKPGKFTSGYKSVSIPSPAQISSKLYGGSSQQYGGMSVGKPLSTPKYGGFTGVTKQGAGYTGYYTPKAKPKTAYGFSSSSPSANMSVGNVATGGNREEEIAPEEEKKTDLGYTPAGLSPIQEQQLAPEQQAEAIPPTPQYAGGPGAGGAVSAGGTGEIITDPVTGNQYKMGAGGSYELYGGGTPYQAAFNQLGGTSAPDSMAGARGQIGQYTAEPEDTTSALIEGDDFIQTLVKTWQDFISPKNQKDSLVETYKELMAETGIEQMDTDLLNQKNVIEGSEDDIRMEITKAGGFATESQVQALTIARNKQLIKNYNTLLETRNAKEKYLETMMGLEAQDRERADARFNSMFNMGMQIATFNQQAIQSTANRLEFTMQQPGGFEAISNDYFTNKTVRGIVDKYYGGLAGMRKMAFYAEETRQLERSKLASSLYTESLQQQKLLRELGGDEEGATITATEQQIENVDQLLDTNDRIFNRVVGNIPGFATLQAMGGEAQDFISTIETITSGLSLEALIAAKSRGATFGALSDTEMRILASAASRIGARAVKDSSGKTKRYTGTVSALKSDLELIRKMATIDYKKRTGMSYPERGTDVVIFTD